jgi:hypothetical protein
MWELYLLQLHDVMLKWVKWKRFWRLLGHRIGKEWSQPNQNEKRLVRWVLDATEVNKMMRWMHWVSFSHGIWRNYKSSGDIPVNLLTLVNQSPKLSRAEDQRAVKPGGVIHGGETDGPRNGCSLRETRCLPPHLVLAERTCCCVFCMSHQNCHNYRQTSECW